MEHIPVLVDEVVSSLNLKPNDDVIDATINGGGHAFAILKIISPNGKLLGIDLDTKALDRTREKLSIYIDQVILKEDNFKNLRKIAEENNFTNCSAILFDLGLSSLHLAGTKGFSFQSDAPLDMRYGRFGLTAAEVVNTYLVEELEKIFYENGERLAKKIARAIIEQRKLIPFRTTTQLTTLITAIKPRRGKIHPATKVFQALRIAVNDEKGSIEQGLDGALEILNKQGRIAVITFHSGEDRLVKNIFKKFVKEGRIRLINKKVIRPLRTEVLHNPRSRSAKLRAIEKIGS